MSGSSGSTPSQPEQGTYDASIYQLQATDDCQGASTAGQGILNMPLLSLANRTGWLKAAIAAVVSSLTGYALINSPEFTGTPTAPTPPQGDNSGALVTTAWLAATPPTVGSNGQLSTISTSYGTSTNAEVSYQQFPNGRVEIYFHNIVFTGSTTVPNDSDKVCFCTITLPFTLPNGVLSACFMPTDIGGNTQGVTPEATITLVYSGRSQLVLAAQGASLTQYGQIAVSGIVVGY